MTTIKIFISCNSQSYVPQHPLLYPIQTGAALTDVRYADMLCDNSGLNISDRNESYCELTAQYWAWKNEDADYFGFMHNRRYLSFSDSRLTEDRKGHVRMGHIDEAAVAKLGYDPEHMRAVIEAHDIVTVDMLDLKKEIPFPAKPTVHRQYANSFQHNIADLDLALQILTEKHPNYLSAAKEYIASDRAYFYNIFIMSRSYFHDYCAWLFDILEEFERRLDMANCPSYGKRKTAFIAERLFGIYMTHLKRSCSPRIRHCQLGFFASLDAPYPVPVYTDRKPVVMAMVSSEEYAPYLGVLLRSVADNASPDRFYDIVVLSVGISVHIRELLALELRGYGNFSLRFVDITSRVSGGHLPTRYHITSASYARLMLPDVLRQYDKVLYMDCDMVVNADPAQVYDTDVSGAMLAAVRDTFVAGWYHMPWHEMKHQIDHVLALDSPYDYFNAGLMVLNLKRFREATTADGLLELARAHRWLWMDQDLLNYVCKGSVQYLEQDWNVMVHSSMDPNSMDEICAPKWLYDRYNLARHSPRAIHYAGGSLPSKGHESDLFWHFWRYARRSAFYEPLLGRMTTEKIGEARITLSKMVQLLKSGCRHIARPVIRLLLPVGSKRREAALAMYRHRYK